MQSEHGPRVFVRIKPAGKSLQGRLEARNLKPSFAYQLKLRGDPAHCDDFERIGDKGRWRLPGEGTNYTDADYEQFADKTKATAYILFDFFS